MSLKIGTLMEYIEHKEFKGVADVCPRSVSYFEYLLKSLGEPGGDPSTPPNDLEKSILKDSKHDGVVTKIV